MQYLNERCSEAYFSVTNPTLYKDNTPFRKAYKTEAESLGNMVYDMNYSISAISNDTIATL
jgi:hypothetical protein